MTDEKWAKRKYPETYGELLPFISKGVNIRKCKVGRHGKN